MTGDTNGAPASYGALLRAIEGLRDDVREDLGLLERRVMTALDAARSEQAAFVVAHGEVHAEDRQRRITDNSRFDTFIRAAELAQARRDGLLGAFRFLIETTSRHAPRLIAVLATVIAGLLTVSGNLTVTVR